MTNPKVNPEPETATPKPASAEKSEEMTEQDKPTQDETTAATVSESPEGSEMRTRNAQKLLRRWVGRSHSMLMRHKGIDPVHDAFEALLRDRAAEFAQAYDAGVTERKSGAEVREQLGSAVQRIKGIITKWRPLLEVYQVQELPDPSGRLQHDEDVISHAAQIREFLNEERIAQSTMTPELAELLFTQLDETIETAQALVSKSQELNAARTHELAEARRTARAYEDVLVAYRQTLRTLLGRGHSDVRAITKMQRASAGEEVEGAVEKAVGEPTTDVAA